MGHALRLAALAVLLPVAACSARGGAGLAGGEAAAPHGQGAAQPPGRPEAHAHEHAEAAHGHAHAGPYVLPATAGPGFTVADVRFMQDMIGHHAQAIEMARMAATHGAGEAVRKLAEKIDISQSDEIALMEQWLVERGQAVPDEEYRRAVRMPGMLTPEQMAQLDAARGPEFDRLFLTFMIGHHRGALEMVEALFASPGAAQDPDIFRFATDVDADQRDEIYIMQSVLSMLATTGGSGS
ncbi:MAG TPA: DUF305 domain-containing protein [Longimicrobiales bacterium]